MTIEEQVAKAHALANAYEDAGNPMVAGLLRVEASNIALRLKDWKPVHKPSLGPYSDENPCVCMHCGLSSKEKLRAAWIFRDCDQRLCKSSLE